MTLKLFISLLLPTILFLTEGCHPPTDPYDEKTDPSDKRKNKESTETEHASRSKMLQFTDLFPFDDSENRWEFRDSDDNLFIIEVKDTISDESDIYYKVSFLEDKLDSSQDNWFLRDKNSVYYNSRLRGTFQTFLPDTYKENGGAFSSNGYIVHYEVYSELNVGGREYKDVVELRYARAFLHGFDKIYFANGVGVIRLVDEDGRWPIDYQLTKAMVNGEELDI